MHCQNATQRWNASSTCLCGWKQYGVSLCLVDTYPCISWVQSPAVGFANAHKASLRGIREEQSWQRTPVQIIHSFEVPVSKWWHLVVVGGAPGVGVCTCPACRPSWLAACLLLLGRSCSPVAAAYVGLEECSLLTSCHLLHVTYSKVLV